VGGREEIEPSGNLHWRTEIVREGVTSKKKKGVIFLREKIGLSRKHSITKEIQNEKLLL